MNLNNINLTPHQIADLYSNVLVENKTIDVPEKHNIPVLGSNKKNILVLVNYGDVPFLPDEQLNFLMNVLGACTLTLTDVAIVNQSKTNLTYNKYIEHFKSKYVLLFNVEPLKIDLPINFPYFQIQQFNGLTFIYSPSLEQIETDKELKKKLWTGLKKMFGI